MNKSVSFLLFNEQWPAMSILNDEQRGKLLQAFFFESGACEEMPGLDQATMGIFLLIQQRIRDNKEKYESKCLKNKANGLKGGRPKNPQKPNGFFDNPLDTDTDLDTDSSLREEVKDPNGSYADNGEPLPSPQPPDCPHDEIREIYHSTLPELPRTVTWGTDRQKNLRARWRETWERLRKAEKPHDKEALLAWWKTYFARVRASPFLMGQITDRQGKPFFADLAWLILPGNYAKVIDGKYLDRTRQGVAA